jgi:hypothetical protein
LGLVFLACGLLGGANSEVFFCTSHQERPAWALHQKSKGLKGSNGLWAAKEAA